VKRCFGELSGLSKLARRRASNLVSQSRSPTWTARAFSKIFVLLVAAVAVALERASLASSAGFLR
jgi:hypothetical protein